MLPSPAALLKRYVPAANSPAAEPSLKLLEEGDFMRAWGGIAGLQYALPATWHPWQQAGMNLTRFAQVGRCRGADAAQAGRAVLCWLLGCGFCCAAGAAPSTALPAAP